MAKKKRTMKKEVKKPMQKGLGFPLLLIFLGIYFIGKDLGWWAMNGLSFWPVFIFVLGLFLLVKNLFLK